MKNSKKLNSPAADGESHVSRAERHIEALYRAAVDKLDLDEDAKKEKLKLVMADFNKHVEEILESLLLPGALRGRKPGGSKTK